MLGGVFFILIGFYWILVFWWTRISDNASQRVSFSVLTIIWFVLAMFFVGVTAALATEVYEHSQVIANFTSDLPCKEESMDTLPYHYNIIPLLALSSMILVWLVYLCLFLVNACCA